VTRHYAAEVIEIECGDAGVLADIDTAADLAKVPR
jgi:hypothetical protein